MTERPIAYIIDSRGQTHFNFVVVYADGERSMYNTVGTPFKTHASTLTHETEPKPHTSKNT